MKRGDLPLGIGANGAKLAQVEYNGIVGSGTAMQHLKFVYWQDGDAWLGYLQEYPDYWTQGETLDDLKEHLKDLFLDVSSGEIAGIRKVGELAVP